MFGIWIGLEYDCQFFLGKTIKEKEGPVTSSTILIWVLSGNLENGRIVATILNFNSQI